MAATSSPPPVKKEFIEDQLGRNPQATKTTINEAWAQAGHAGGISSSLVYKVKSELGLTGRGRSERKLHGAGARTKRRVGRPRKEPSSSPGDNGTQAAPARRSGRESARLSELEADFDRLLFKLINLGTLPDVEDLVRRARRLVIVAPR